MQQTSPAFVQSLGEWQCNISGLTSNHPSDNASIRRGESIGVWRGELSPQQTAKITHATATFATVIRRS